MRALLIAVLVLGAAAASAQQTPAPVEAQAATRVVVEREPLLQRTSSMNTRLQQALMLLGRSRRDRQLQELLQGLQAELTDVNNQVAGAPMERPGLPPPQQQPPPPQQRPPPPPNSFPPPQPNFPTAPPVQVRPRPTIQPIADATLQALMGAIQKESFSDNRIAVLRQAVPSHFFLVSQVQQILPLYTFSADKLQAMRLLKPRMLDPENAFRLYDSFTFSADKEELGRILAE